MMIKPGEVAAAAGLGLAAGLAGTAVMTVSAAIEEKIRGRPASTAPADAAGKVLGVKPEGPEQAKRFATVVHWAYGTGWGVARGLLGCTRLPAAAAGAVHLATIWLAEQAVLPALDVSPPVTKWGWTEAGIDAWHHLAYEAAATVTYELLDRAR